MEFRRVLFRSYDPLGHPPPQTRHDADKRSYQAASDRKPEMAEGILDSLPSACRQAPFRQFTGYGAATDGEINDFRNGEKTDQDRDQVKPAPEVKLGEGKALHSRLRVLADQRD